MINCINIVEGILTCIAILISGFVAVYFYVPLTPKIDLRIIPEWGDKKGHKLILRLEIENKSKVRANIKSIQLQILEYNQEQEMLSEWVPFSQCSIRKNEHPLQWKEPETICQTSKRIYPNEIIKIERLYTFTENKIWHVGLQLQVEYKKWIEKLIPKKATQWTTTKIVYPPLL
jgi:hypothetical protein